MKLPLFYNAKHPVAHSLLERADRDNLYEGTKEVIEIQQGIWVIGVRERAIENQSEAHQIQTQESQSHPTTDEGTSKKTAGCDTAPNLPYRS